MRARDARDLLGPLLGHQYRRRVLQVGSAIQHLGPRRTTGLLECVGTDAVLIQRHPLHVEVEHARQRLEARVDQRFGQNHVAGTG